MMMVRQAARVLHAPWSGKDVLFNAVSTDSRTLEQGNLFVALTGKRFDGSRFVASAVEKGAAAVMVDLQADSHNFPLHIPLIKVKDTRLGLGQLAAYWRSRFRLPIIGVTGSNGKTTVKEMIASILRQAPINIGAITDEWLSHVLATEGNLNNDIGVPKMLLQIRQHHQYAVIEMGMNHIGEISNLTKLVKPSVALITNAGAAHIQELGSVEAIARAKAEIFEGLDQQKGIGVINSDDMYASLWRKYIEGRQVMDFGLHDEARISAKFQSNPLISRIKLKLPDGNIAVQLHVPGVHNIYNALAAAAATAALGINKALIASGLENFKGVQGRMQKKLGLHHALLIDDTYNANPESVRAALAFLSASAGKKILVLGDMGELGNSAMNLHRAIGRDARKAGLDQLLTLGELSAYATAEFGKGARHFNSIDELLNVAEGLLAENVTLLIKGSRFMQMERLVSHLEIKHP